MPPSKPYCILPWYHQTVRANGMYPCCAWPYQAIPGNHRDFFHGKFMEDLRERMLSGDPPDMCSGCVDMDAMDASSLRRMGWEMADHLGIDWTDGPKLRSQEVNPSNVCNLRCRTCNSHSSTKWIADELALGIEVEDGGRLLDSGWHLDDDLAASTMKLAFLGGEPMLHQEVIMDALGKIDRLGRMDELTIDITTNGTVAPDSRLLDMMSRSRTTYLNISVDAVGRLNDYIRSDSDWETVQSVVDLYDGALGSLPNAWLSITTVLSTMNVNRIMDFWPWLEKYKWQGSMHSINFCTTPEIYDARILPRDYKKAIIDELRALRRNTPNRKESLFTVMSYLEEDIDGSDAYLRTMRRVIDALDLRRDQHLSDYNPDLSRLLDAQEVVGLLI